MFAIIGPLVVLGIVLGAFLISNPPKVLKNAFIGALGLLKRAEDAALTTDAPAAAAPSAPPDAAAVPPAGNPAG